MAKIRDQYPALVFDAYVSQSDKIAKDQPRVNPSHSLTMQLTKTMQIRSTALQRNSMTGSQGLK